MNARSPAGLPTEGPHIRGLIHRLPWAARRYCPGVALSDRSQGDSLDRAPFRLVPVDDTVLDTRTLVEWPLHDGLCT